MNNDTTTPKPTQPEQPSPKGLDDASCYALFSGHCYYPDGGAEDFRAWGTIEELKQLYASNADKWSMDAAGSYVDPWGQIAERETMAVILTIRGHGDWVDYSPHNAEL